MPKPPRIIRPVKKNLSLPEDLVLKVDLELYSNAEQRVPHAAWSQYVSKLIEDDLRERYALRAGQGELQV